MIYIYIINVSGDSDLDHEAPTHSGSHLAHAGAEGPVHLVVAADQQRRGWPGEVGRIGGQPIASESDHGVVPELERGGDAGVDLEVRSGIEGKPGVGTRGRGRDAERRLPARAGSAAGEAT
jgi:hypothetical protein